MIVGLGTDILDIKRFKTSLEKYDEQILNRIFTPDEQAYCESKQHFRLFRYAKRFAAKEAALKALGTGRSDDIKWSDVFVKNNSKGKPMLMMTGKALEVLIEKQRLASSSFHIHLSLSDSDDYATATVIIEEVPENQPEDQLRAQPKSQNTPEQKSSGKQP